MGHGKGPLAAKRAAGIQTPLMKLQWGVTPIQGPVCTEEERQELKRTGYYSVQWRQLRSKK